MNLSYKLIDKTKRRKEIDEIAARINDYNARQGIYTREEFIMDWRGVMTRNERFYNVVE